MSNEISRDGAGPGRPDPDAKTRREEPGKPRLRFKLSPELADGQSWTVVDHWQDVIQSITDWYENEPTDGESFSVEMIEMTDEEFNAMPEL